jgi:hypothetical protein
MGKGWYGILGYVKEIIESGGRLFPFKIGKIHTGLGQLLAREFTFFAIPVKVRGATFFPVKAFAVMG